MPMPSSRRRPSASGYTCALRLAVTPLNRHKTLLSILVCMIAVSAFWPPAIFAEDQVPKYAPTSAFHRPAGGPDEDLRTYAPATFFGVPSAAQMLVSPGTTIGETYYDYQHNSSTGRQVDEFGGMIQASYMRQSLPQISPGRKVFWNRVAVAGSASNYTLDNGETIRRFPLGVPATPLGIEVGPEDQQGYTTMRLAPNGRAAVFYHAIGALGSWAVALDKAADSGVFTGTAAPQPFGLTDPAIWPHSAVDVVGADTILHVVATGSGVGLQGMWYWRGLVGAGTSLVIWSSPVLIASDVPGEPAAIEVDPTSNRVVIVYAHAIPGAETNYGFNVAYVLSTDGGLTWGSSTPITAYTVGTQERANQEVAAAFDSDGTLHVLYTTECYYDVPTIKLDLPLRLLHWDDGAQASRTVAAAYWDNTCSSVDTRGYGYFGPLITKPSISVKPAGAGPGGGIPGEMLYAVWVQFGPTDTDCAAYNSGDYINGELWYSVSSNDGATWDRPRNITGTETPECAPADCHSEHWVSTAALVDSGLYISYIDDTHAGGIVQNQGAWSLSPYKVLALEARAASASPRQVVLPVDPAEWSKPVSPSGTTISLVAPSPGVTTNKISVSNPGTATLNFTATITNDGDVSNNPLVNGTLTYNGSIAAGGAPETLTVSFDPVGASKYYMDFTLAVTSNDSTWNPTAGGTPFTLHWKSGVPDDQYWVPLGTGTNGEVRALIEYNGKLIAGGSFSSAGGNPANNIASWDGVSWSALGPGLPVSINALAIYNGKLCAAGQWGSGLVATWDGASWSWLSNGLPGGGTVYALTVFNNELIAGGDLWDGHNGFGVARWNGTSWLSRGLTNVWALAIYNGELYAGGQFTDWSRICGASGLVRWDAGTQQWKALGDGLKQYPLGIRELVVHDNKLWAGGRWTDCPGYQRDLSPWDGTTWGEDLFWSGGCCMSLFALCVYNNELIAGGSGLLNPASSNTFGSGISGGVMALSVYNGRLIAGGSFTRAGNRTAANIAAWGVASGCPIAMTGDINLSSSITSADVIGLVNYVFKGGAAPLPCIAAGDVNCSGTVTSADIIGLVGFVFKSGTPPCDGCTSPLAGGC